MTMAKRASGRKKRRGAAGRAAAAPPRTPISEITPEQQIVGALLLGKVRHYFAKLNVMTLVAEAPLAVGDTIRVKGHTTDLTQRVERIELEHVGVPSVSAGEEIALAVADRVREGDAVYKL